MSMRESCHREALAGTSTVRIHPQPRRVPNEIAQPRQGLARVPSTHARCPAAREILRDAFTRLIEHVDDLTDGLTDEVSFFRPTGEANSICWLIWHSARIQDVQGGSYHRYRAGVDQRGWVDRFALDLPRDAHGYSHTAEDVGKVRAPAELLARYYHSVHKMTLEYVAGVTAEELARVVDENWSPPVTASVRLVSIIDDCAQHLGQAAYVRGLAGGRLVVRAVSRTIDRTLLGWPLIGLPTMVLLGLGVRDGATPLDGFFQQAHDSPLSSLLFFTDYRTAGTLVGATAITALYRRIWLLVPLAVVVPFLAVHATEALKPWFGRMKEKAWLSQRPHHHAHCGVGHARPGCRRTPMGGCRGGGDSPGSACSARR